VYKCINGTKINKIGHFLTSALENYELWYIIIKYEYQKKLSAKKEEACQDAWLHEAEANHFR
jgi:hypothetical protein